MTGRLGPGVPIVMDAVGQAVGRLQEERPLPADLLESDDAYLAVFDAPGAESRDVQVKYEGNDVVVRVDRFRQVYDDYDMRFPGRGLTLTGRVSLPEDAAVDPENGTATLKETGVVHVRVPKVWD